jgi:hypothetical protein
MTARDDGHPTSRLFQDAIRADVHARVDLVMGRLEHEIEDLRGAGELEQALERALADVADAMAEGIVAQLREAQRLDRGS